MFGFMCMAVERLRIGKLNSALFSKTATREKPSQLHARRNQAKQSPIHSWTLGHNTMQDADNQEVRIGTERVCASTVGPKVATPCQAQLHAEISDVLAQDLPRHVVICASIASILDCDSTLFPLMTLTSARSAE